MSSDNHHDLLRVAHQVVTEAKGIFDKADPGDRTAKGDRDFATEVDVTIEHRARDRLATLTPDIGFLGEELGGTTGLDRWWCLDPIDGTVNFEIDTYAGLTLANFGVRAWPSAWACEYERVQCGHAFGGS